MALTDSYVFAEFLCKKSSYKKKEEKEKKEKDIYSTIFNCDIIGIEQFDTTGTMAGFTPQLTSLDQTFTERINSRMYSTLANMLLQKHAGRSLSIEVKLVRKITTENSLEGEGRNEYHTVVQDNHGHKYF